MAAHEAGRAGRFTWFIAGAVLSALAIFAFNAWSNAVRAPVSISVDAPELTPPPPNPIPETQAALALK